jgi:hemerythrin-like domain-containing protein
MKTASQRLLHEHNAILVAMDIIERICEYVQNDREVDVNDISDIIRFLEVYINSCHHRKEQQLLFPALEEVGVTNHNGLIGVLVTEHQMEYDYILQMKDTLTYGEFNKPLFLDAAAAYVQLIRNHIIRENTVLFRISDAKFSDETQKRLLEEFKNIDNEVIGEASNGRFVQLLKTLKEKYSFKGDAHP